MDMEKVGDACKDFCGGVSKGQRAPMGRNRPELGQTSMKFNSD